MEEKERKMSLEANPNRKIEMRYSKRGSRGSSRGITCELVRNAESQAPPISTKL